MQSQAMNTPNLDAILEGERHWATTNDEPILSHEERVYRLFGKPIDGSTGALAELASLRTEVDSLGSKLAKAEMAASDLLEQAQSWKGVYEQRLAGIETLKAENAALLEKARLADDYFARVRDIKYEHRSDYERHWLASYTAATAHDGGGER